MDCWKVVLQAKGPQGDSPFFFKDIRSKTPWIAGLKFMQDTFELSEGEYTEFRITIKQKKEEEDE